MINKLARKGMTPSAIGVLLRDQHAIPGVKAITGSKILRILKAAGLARGGKHGVRLLGKGEFTAKVKFSVTGVSAGAQAAVEKAGGSVTLPEAQPSEHEKKTARREVNTAAKKAAAK